MIIEVIPNEQTPIVPNIIDVNSFIEINKNKLEEFLNYAKTKNNAVGLAANQVSIDSERFMVKVFALRNINNYTWKLIINPTIDKYIGISEIKGEGCLTWVNKIIVAKRNRAVEVSYYDMSGNKHSNEFYKGFEAQIWQHEINHLNGIEEQVEELNYIIPAEINVGRNDPCPCGSGKKYKICCLFLQ